MPESAMVERCGRWCEEGWLEQQIDAACATADPVLCNLLVTPGPRRRAREA